MGPGWYPDPTGRQPLRWFDGTRWTPQALDGWQRPVVDPLPTVDDAGSETPPSGLAPPATGAVPVVPGPAASPEPRTVPAPGSPPPGSPPPGSAGSPGVPWEQGQVRISQIWRLLVVAGAAVGMAFGFLVLPWIELEFGGHRVAVGYLEFADWARTNGVHVGGWRIAYADGLAVLLAVVGLVVATASAVATILWGRTPGCAVQVLMAVLWALSIAGTPPGRIVDLPWTGPPYAVVGIAPMLVVASYCALMFSIGDFWSGKAKSRRGSS